jgi:hypothetical protein
MALVTRVEMIAVGTNAQAQALRSMQTTAFPNNGRPMFLPAVEPPSRCTIPVSIYGSCHIQSALQHAGSVEMQTDLGSLIWKIHFTEDHLVSSLRLRGGLAGTLWLRLTSPKGDASSIASLDGACYALSYHEG